MPIKTDFSGLNKLKENMRFLENTDTVALADLLSGDFLSGCSSFSSFEEFWSATGFKLDSAVGFETMPKKDLDAFVSKSTSHSTWEEILQEAVNDYAKKQILKGL